MLRPSNRPKLKASGKLEGQCRNAGNGDGSGNAQFVIEVLPFCEHVWQSNAHNRPINVHREAGGRELVNLVVNLFQVCVHSRSAHVAGRVVLADTVRDEKNLPRGTEVSSGTVTLRGLTRSGILSTCRAHMQSRPSPACLVPRCSRPSYRPVSSQPLWGTLRGTFSSDPCL